MNPPVAHPTREPLPVLTSDKPCSISYPRTPVERTPYPSTAPPLPPTHLLLHLLLQHTYYHTYYHTSSSNTPTITPTTTPPPPTHLLLHILLQHTYYYTSSSNTHTHPVTPVAHQNNRNHRRKCPYPVRTDHPALLTLLCDTCNVQVVWSVAGPVCLNPVRGK
jgi:hypothetical protein